MTKLSQTFFGGFFQSGLEPQPRCIESPLLLGGAGSLGVDEAAMKNKPFHRRFGFAMYGIFAGLREESSVRQQALAALFVLAILIVRRPAAIWWALLIMNCGAVLAAELMNTALEHALDHLNPDIHPAIKIAKDCAAGAVLVLSFTALATFLAFLAATWPR